MSMRGHCRCNNIEVLWRTVDFSVVPRACQCSYCRAKGAAYVSKSGTSVNVRIHHQGLHRIIQHGSNNAEFHECGRCGDVVLVSVEIDGEIYGALNAHCMTNRFEFSPGQIVDYAGQSVEQKRLRWRQNWCYPVRIEQ